MPAEVQTSRDKNEKDTNTNCGIQHEANLLVDERDLLDSDPVDAAELGRLRILALLT
jgi:hypothetical protein